MYPQLALIIVNGCVRPSKTWYCRSHDSLICSRSAHWGRARCSVCMSLTKGCWYCENTTNGRDGARKGKRADSVMLGSKCDAMMRLSAPPGNVFGSGVRAGLDPNVQHGRGLVGRRVVVHRLQRLRVIGADHGSEGLQQAPPAVRVARLPCEREDSVGGAGISAEEKRPGRGIRQVRVGRRRGGDERDEEEMARVERALEEVFAYAVELGGTITGEHGVGLAKKPFLPQQLGPVGMDILRRVKASFDPKGILNPGNMFD